MNCTKKLTLDVFIESINVGRRLGLSLGQGKRVFFSKDPRFLMDEKALLLHKHYLCINKQK